MEPEIKRQRTEVSVSGSEGREIRRELSEYVEQYGFGAAIEIDKFHDEIIGLSETEALSLLMHDNEFREEMHGVDIFREAGFVSGAAVTSSSDRPAIEMMSAGGFDVPSGFTMDMPPMAMSAISPAAIGAPSATTSAARMSMNDLGIHEHDGSPVEADVRLPFSSWDGAVQKKPIYTFYPKSRTGLQNIVRWCKANDKSVRASGYRHSGSDLYPDDGDVLVSMLPHDIATHLPAKHPELPADTGPESLQFVRFVDESRGLVQVGAATTNYHFQDWAHSDGPGKGKWQWTLPMNVIMTEITLAGSNAPMCHGAGADAKTLSDIVRAIEFVNVNGELQRVDDPEELKAAAGAFGLLGLVTSLTLQLNPMTYANINPERKTVALAVPPPRGYQIPRQIPDKLHDISTEERDRAEVEFRNNCGKKYVEFFWFPMLKDSFVNCWNDDAEPTREPFPTLADRRKQQKQTNFVRKMHHTFAPKWLSGFAMRSLPKERISASFWDALHFQHGIQNFPAKLMEAEIPIPDDEHGNPDWSIAQRAWWDALSIIYKRDYGRGARWTHPMRLPLEMRIMSGSEICMAAQRNNRYTCAIEILTTRKPHVLSRKAAKKWHKMSQEILDTWMSYTDYRGKRLNVRPHWAKEWKQFEVDMNDGTIKNMPDYLREDAYPDQIWEFKGLLQRIAQNPKRLDGGSLEPYAIDDFFKRFGNDTLSRLFRGAGSVSFASVLGASHHMGGAGTVPTAGSSTEEHGVASNLMASPS